MVQVNPLSRSLANLTQDLEMQIIVQLLEPNIIFLCGSCRFCILTESMG